MKDRLLPLDIHFVFYYFTERYLIMGRLISLSDGNFRGTARSPFSSRSEPFVYPLPSLHFIIWTSIFFWIGLVLSTH